MSAGAVDVLAVFQRDASAARCHRWNDDTTHADDCMQQEAESELAIAVVAELIEALQDCVEAQQPMAQMHATERARAALARVGGAK